MANPPSIKEPTGVISGGAQRWGGPDATHAAKLIKGTHSTEKIQSTAIDGIGLNKLDATVAPTVNNDTTEGYIVGSYWIDVTADKAYVCVDDTDTAAVWMDITAGAASGEINLISSIGGGAANLVATTPKSGVTLRTKTLSVTSPIGLDDTADVLTISTTATVNQSDAVLKDRANHTGAQSQSTITNLTTDLANKSAVGHTHVAANITDKATELLARSKHTGTQLASTISDFNAAVRTNRLDQMTIPTAAVNINGQNVDNVQNIIHDLSTSGVDINFNEDQLQEISISVNTVFTTAGRAIGKSKTLKITTDATLRTLTFPAWKFVGAKPVDQAASKVGILTVTCFGTLDTDIVAAYAVEA